MLNRTKAAAAAAILSQWAYAGEGAPGGCEPPETKDGQPSSLGAFI